MRVPVSQLESLPGDLSSLEDDYNTFSQFVHTPGYMSYPQRYYDEYDYKRLGRQSRFHRRSGGKFPEYSADSNYDYGRANCRCSCRNCENIKPCCVSICDNCNSQSLVFVPYPVPLVVAITSKSTPNTSTTTTSSTTTTTTTTTPSTKTENSPEITFSTPTYARINYRPDFGISTSPFYKKKRLLLGKKNKCLGGQCPNYRRIDLIDHLLRNEDGRQADNYDDFDVKLEKGHQFGIIPIPNKMALEFMTNMRDMKLNELFQSKV
ncbi:unnamed protein product [Pieris brassicae]|uniref:Uncharacterized protein n=1 Tax=Pieris brassicae TaxID=7116 RepID=A0A9P0TDJ3_PIEBR|nr:unnamed protein product [Pieris brassicae]